MFKALPEIEPSGEEYIEPDNDMEKMVCEAFAEVLNLDKAGVTQNFFNIGGHSLRAVRLVISIEAKTGVRIPVKAVFEAKTAGNIAAYILGLGNKNMTDEIKPAEKKEYYPVSGVQKRLYMLDQITDIGVAYNTPQCFELRGNIDEKRLGCAYQKLVDRHETLRTAFEEKGGELVQRIYDHIPAELVVTYVKDNTLSKEYESFIRRLILKKPLL
jgi:acyl carrier protein